MAKIKLLTTSINTSDLDDVPCATCGEIPPDRQSRVDCDVHMAKNNKNQKHSMSIVTWRNYPNMPNAKFIPTWGQYEEAANNQTDAKAALKASDAFEEERAKEMRNSSLS